MKQFNRVCPCARATIIAIVAFLCSLPADAAWGPFYSIGKVHSNDSNGVVYISDSNDNPAESKYSSSASKQQSSGTGSQKAQTHTYYLRAMVKSSVADDYKFEGWYLDDVFQSADLNITMTITTDKNALSGSSNYPTKDYEARFSKIPPRKIKVYSDFATSTAEISPLVNDIGEEVTISLNSRVQYAGKDRVMKNPNIVFDGWYDEAGNLFSSEETVTFTVTEAKNLTARAHNAAETPQAGKYYRIRNIAGRALSLEGNYKVGPNVGTSYLENQTVDASLFRWALGSDINPADYPTGNASGGFSATDDNPAADLASMPSTIYYIESGSAGNGKLTAATIYSQGVKFNNIISNSAGIYSMSSSYPGYYYMRKNNTLAEANDGKFKMGVSGESCNVRFHRDDNDNTDCYSALRFEPIDEAHFDEFYFGAKADASTWHEGGYWTSMYTAFPYECRDGVEAYYVKNTGAFEGKVYAQLTRVEGDRVPANAAVILKCQSTESAHNRLMPLAPGSATGNVDGNMLHGEFQLYTNSSRAGRKHFDANTMRVLGSDGNGNVGFMKLEDNTELAPNKVWLDASALPSADVIFLPAAGTGETVIDTYARIIDADGSYLAVEDASGVPVNVSQEMAVANAGSIFHISAVKSWEGVATVCRLTDLSAQGVQAHINGFVPGKMIYEVSADADGNIVMKSADSQITFIPTDGESEVYAPALTTEFWYKDYAGLYLDFPVEAVGDGMVCYAVSEIGKKDLVNDVVQLYDVAYVDLVELTDVIPARTPFIVELDSQNNCEVRFAVVSDKVIRTFTQERPESLVEIPDVTTAVQRAPQRIDAREAQSGVLRGTLLSSAIDRYALGLDSDIDDSNPLYRMKTVEIGKVNSLGFSNASEGSLNANEAYMLPGEPMSDDQILVGEPNIYVVTGIEEISNAGDNADMKPDTLYTVDGVRVAKPQKGQLYILNGKKVILL